MVWYPEVQKKAQAELDAVLGKGHLPDFSDEASLPYCNALVKEVFRWRPATPIAIPRETDTEDVYQGMRIPASSVIINNAWYAFLAACLAVPDIMRALGQFFTTKETSLSQRFSDQIASLKTASSTPT